MRREQPSIPHVQQAADFRINFQMTDGGTRRACRVTIQAASKIDADTIFRENWSTIEKLARMNLAADGHSEIRLETAPTR